MKKIITLVLLGISLILCSSCATLFAGGSPKVLIDGDVNEPVTIKTEKSVYENVTLPAMVEVKRHKIDGQRITIKSENYEYKDIVLQKKVNGWTWGNIALGGIPGWCVDLITNCVSAPKEKEYKITAQQK